MRQHRPVQDDSESRPEVDKEADVASGVSDVDEMGPGLENGQLLSPCHGQGGWRFLARQPKL
jgi:hypothetical protein